MRRQDALPRSTPVNQPSLTDSRVTRALLKRLRCKLGGDTNNLTYIFIEARVGYPIANGETPEQAEP